MTHPTINRLCQSLAEIAPLRLAEDWDNVGLLVGDRSAEIARVMTCLTLSTSVVDEAIAENADLVITHHPLPFKPISRITSDSITGNLLLRLIRSGTAVYSAHTAFDSAANGINQMWADRLGLCNVKPLVENDSELTTHASPGHKSTGLGAGRFGDLTDSITLGALAQRAATKVSAKFVRRVGSEDAFVSRVALACGSGGSFLMSAQRAGCHAMITGEATFHTCLEAQALGVSLVLLGHYQSERFAMELLAEQLSALFPELTIWPSRNEYDPIELV